MSAHSAKMAATPGHVSKKVESDDEDWEDVYYVLKGVDSLCGKHEHLKIFKTYSTEWIKAGDPPEGDYKTTYFQTFGGGPEGGYFLRTFTSLNGLDPIHEVYRVERNWNEPFKVERLNGSLDFRRNDDGDKIRFIPR